MPLAKSTAARIRSSPPNSSGVSTMWISALWSLENMAVKYDRAGGPQLGMYCSKIVWAASKLSMSQPRVASV